MTNKPSVQYRIGAGSESIAMKTNIPPLILVGRDTIHLKLKEFKERCQAKMQVFSAASFSFSLLMALITTDTYTDLGGLGIHWETIFKFGLALSLVWLAISGYVLWRNRKKLGEDYTLREICMARKEDVPLSVATDSNYDLTPLN